MAKKKQNARERRQQERQSRIDKAVKKPCTGMPPESMSDIGHAQETPVAENGPVLKKETKPDRRCRKAPSPSVLRPGPIMPREDGRPISPVPLTVRLDLESLMRTLRKEYPDEAGTLYVRTDGQCPLELGPQLSYSYKRGLYTRLDPAGSRSRTSFLLPYLLKAKVEAVLLEQPEGRTDWYITLSGADGAKDRQA